MKTKTRTELAHEFGVDRKTLYRWLKKAEIILSGTTLTPKELELIYLKLGKPNKKI